MAKKNQKQSAANKRRTKASKLERQSKYEWVFINGRQVRIKRSETIDGLPVDEFIQLYADPIWLHQNCMWELIDSENYVSEKAVYHFDEAFRDVSELSAAYGDQSSENLDLLLRYLEYTQFIQR